MSKHVTLSIDSQGLTLERDRFTIERLQSLGVDQRCIRDDVIATCERLGS